MNYFAYTDLNDERYYIKKDGIKYTYETFAEKASILDNKDIEDLLELDPYIDYVCCDKTVIDK
jgi:hypothetical protein